METEMIILGIGLGVLAVERGYKLYKKYMADGKITLDEVLEMAEMAKDLPSLSQVKKMKKADLVALCEEHNIDAKGVKADLIARLEEVIE
tara:strand:- start:693 stop:962 length:270 start_codon:yes stop_codon:yes gene_type:complete